jgi:signal transduction histidine kinase
MHLLRRSPSDVHDVNSSREAVNRFGVGRMLRGLQAAAILGLSGWVVMVVGGTPRPLLSALIGIAAVSTLWGQRRWPVLTLTAAFGALVATAELGFEGPDDPFLALIIWAAFGVGRYAAFRHQPWAAAGTLFFLSLNVWGDDVRLPGDAIFPVLIAAAPWILGLLVQVARANEGAARESSAQLLAAQEERMRQATEAERLRLARELHDVAAHTMSAVSLQVQVLRRRLEAGEPVTASDARQIEASAREALVELRHVVGVLRPPTGAARLSPQPSIDDLPQLIRQCKAASQGVDLKIRGESTDVSDGLSLCAYRIVQEALANARRHGGSGRTEVLVEWRSHCLRLRIKNPLDPARSGGGTGHGLIGMRERAELYGGSLVAGPSDPGYWVVDADLPFRRTASVTP